MILVIGSLGAGKRHYVTQHLGYGEADISLSVQDVQPVLMDLHEHIRAAGYFDGAWLPALLAKEVVVCNEVGSGIVPLDTNERAWRDEVGRACAQLAAEAQMVVRLVCGIPQIIKGPKP